MLTQRIISSSDISVSREISLKLFRVDMDVITFIKSLEQSGGKLAKAFFECSNLIYC
jgi:hypothetical protein